MLVTSMEQIFIPCIKKRCDTYFWNAHRNEARGIGGLFFDYLKETEEFSLQDRYDFVIEIGNSFFGELFTNSSQT